MSSPQANNRLTKNLIRTASEFTGVALESYADSRISSFYLNAGIGLEHLLKARLCSISPVLIADPKSFNSILLLAQMPDDEIPPPIFQTISVSEALTRYQTINPSMKPILIDLKQLVSYRNGAAHIGITARGDATSDLINIALLQSCILKELDVARESFYEHFNDLIEDLVDKSSDRVRIATSAAIAAAQAEYRRRYGDSIPSPNLEEALNGTDLEYRYESQPIECPACQCTALLFGTSEAEWSRASGSEDVPRNSNTAVSVFFYADHLECRLCGLSLRGASLPASGIPYEMELSDFDIADFDESDDCAD